MENKAATATKALSWIIILIIELNIVWGWIRFILAQK